MSVAVVFRHRVITEHSSPRMLVFVGEMKFISEICRKVCNFCAVHVFEVAQYKPSSNGLIARTNNEIIAVLKTLITPDVIDWRLVLDDGY